MLPAPSRPRARTPATPAVRSWRRLLAVFLVAAAAGEPGAARDGRPNIVVILSDDQGYADLGSNPHHRPEVATPHLDALAREGVRLTQGYISGPVC